MTNKESNKQIKVSPEIHKDIKLMAVQENREMREIVTAAYQFYKKYRFKLGDKPNDY